MEGSEGEIRGVERRKNEMDGEKGGGKGQNKEGAVEYRKGEGGKEGGKKRREAEGR